MSIMGGKIKITTYTYRIRTAFAVSFGPVDEFIRLDYNSDFKYYNQGRSGAPLVFATSESLLQGNFYWGDDTQGYSSNLSVMHEGMYYRHIAYADFHLDLGAAPAMPATAFTLTRYFIPDLPDPHQWTYQTGSASGLNPAIMLYDLLTNPFYGYGLSPNDIDTDSFVNAHLTLHDEDLSASTCISTTEVYSVVRAILDWIDAEIVYREFTGKIGLRLKRKDYLLEDLIVVTASDIRAQTFDLQRPSWYATKNVVYVNFNDIDRECDQNCVYAEDLANFNLTYSQRVQEFNFDVFTSFAMAQKIATRQLHRHAYPWAKVAFECFAQQGDQLQVYEPFWLQHEYYGVSAVYRVTEKRRQGANIWKIEAVEETFCTDSSFAAGNDEPYVKPYITFVPIAWNYRTLDSYYRGFLVFGYSDVQNTTSILDAFTVQTLADSSSMEYACVGRLTAPIGTGSTAEIYVLKDIHFQEDFSIVDYVLIDDEIFKINNASEGADDVHYTSHLTSRALEGTSQASHSIGAKAFALDCRAFVSTNMIPGVTYSFLITPHYMAPIVCNDAEDAVSFIDTWNDLIDIPMSPVIQNHSSDDYHQNILFTWSAQNRQTPIPTPCSGLSAYPHTTSGDQILGWKLYHCPLGAGTTSLLTVSVNAETLSYTSNYAARLAAGLSTNFRFEVYAKGVKGWDSIPDTIEIF